MKGLRALSLGLCLVLDVGCSGKAPPARQPVEQPRMAATFSLPDFVSSLTPDQIRKANAAGLPFSELTLEQQRAVSAMWEQAGKSRKEMAAQAGTRDLPAAGPAEEVRIVMAGYSETANGNEVLLELRGGNFRYMPGYAPERVPAALKEAGKDLVAAGISELVTDESTASFNGQ